MTSRGGEFEEGVEYTVILSNIHAARTTAHDVTPASKLLVTVLYFTEEYIYLTVKTMKTYGVILTPGNLNKPWSFEKVIFLKY